MMDLVKNITVCLAIAHTHTHMTLYMFTYDQYLLVVPAGNETDSLWSILVCE